MSTASKTSTTPALHQVGPGRFPPLRTVANTNLPRPVDAFVGRSAEVDEVRRALRGGTRLLTLTGPGGVGKTRLALEAAADLVGAFGAGTFWIDLAAVREPGQVMSTLEATLGARSPAEHIGDREMPLLLDNLEQVIEVAPELGGLLDLGIRRSPGL